MVRIAVVGGGIAGLAAALRLRDLLPETTITVYEQSNVLGGKLATRPLRGVDGTTAPVETGAEMFLTGDPAGGQSAAVALAGRLGLAGDLAHPEGAPAAVVVDGVLRPLPTGTLLGVPPDLSILAGVAEPTAGLDRDEGRPLLAPGEDVAVGELVRRRLGDQVVDRLVDPLLGGVYAGRADQLSLAATIPALARTAREESTLVGAVRAALRASARPAGPVFATVQGGLSTLVATLTAELRSGRYPVEFRFGLPVRELHRDGGGWRIGQGRASAVQWQRVDAVVLALPAHRAARLLGKDLHVDYASVGLVTLALPTVELPALSGFLVPATEGRTVKAATFFTRKWAHQRRPDGTVLVRASVGRFGEEDVLRATDEELVTRVRADLCALLGPLPGPVATRVTRWGGALPQYAPGHVDRVAAARADLRAAAPTVALAGAGYDGVGIPACIRSGTAAAEEIAAVLRE